MKTIFFYLTVILLAVNFSGCGLMRPGIRPVPLTDMEREICDFLEIDEDMMAEMKAKPLYDFSEKEIDKYLGYLQLKEPDLRTRVQHLARKTLNQPYQIYLLGEFPFELYDTEPMYSLKKSDCVVFSEHTYAMALADSWRDFMILLQRIRYKNGEIGMLTRNHYTMADWNRNNSWLLEDITEKLGGIGAVTDTMIVDRARFFSKYGIGRDIVKEEVEFVYIPYDLLPEVEKYLQPGDFVNIVRGNAGGKWVGHVGLITRGADGTVNFLHSTWPRVKEQPVIELSETADAYNEERRQYNADIEIKNAKIRAHNARVEKRGRGKKKNILNPRPYFYGFRFLRLRENPLEELLKMDGNEDIRIYLRLGEK